jgi:hypothetical protein
VLALVSTTVDDATTIDAGPAYHDLAASTVPQRTGLSASVYFPPTSRFVRTLTHVDQTLLPETKNSKGSVGASHSPALRAVDRGDPPRKRGQFPGLPFSFLPRLPVLMVVFLNVAVRGTNSMIY